MKLKLFYILYAGGFALSASRFIPYLKNDDVELVPIEYAGRGMRSNEQKYESFEHVVQDVVKQINKQAGDDPYIIWGHSMGALVAYEVCHKMNSVGNNRLKHAIFSGQDAPNSKHIKKEYHLLSKPDRIKFINKLGGIPEEITESSDWFNFFLSYIESDLLLMDQYKYINRGKLNYKCVVMYGKEDESIHILKNDWEELFFNISYKVHEGGHFFIFDEIELVMENINQIIDEVRDVHTNAYPPFKNRQ
ncbi:MAG: thioesterase domain-containing protein [Defluviitaleaceae bacterium]|nr:thioesterase domain-containing protein [Defluviitaleaceae bacterium]